MRSTVPKPRPLLTLATVAGQRAFGSKLVTNVFRGLVAEAIVASALCDEWKWCSEDYYPYDFIHKNGTRLEVKQSAACQSWTSTAPFAPRWDIGARKGFYEGEKFIAQPGRNADIYVLALHPVRDRDAADHRNPDQWEFYVGAGGGSPDHEDDWLVEGEGSRDAGDDHRAACEGFRDDGPREIARL